MVAAPRMKRRQEGALVARRPPPPVGGNRVPPHRSNTKASPPPLKLATLEASATPPAPESEFAPQALEHIAELARRYLFSGASTMARDLFRSLHLLRPSESYFALGCGLSEESEGRWEEAKKWYGEALRLDPGDPWVACNVAELCLHAGRHREAGAWLERIAKSPISDAALRSRVEAMARLPALQVLAR